MQVKVKTLIYQTRQMRAFESLAAEKFQLTGDVLMQRAGKAALEFLQKRWPQAKKILIVSGSGNNGGDAYVLAGLLRELSYEVTIWQIGKAPLSRPADLSFTAFDVNQAIPPVDVIVDGICGIGLHDDLCGDAAAAVQKLQHSHIPILALDVPTGINADTGAVCGGALYATATITFIGHKLGLLTGSGSACAGELFCHDLQLPPGLFDMIPAVAEKMDLRDGAHWLKPRTRDWHKGRSGHVLVIGGDLGYAGAPRMAAEAALRVGAGLVTVATRPEHTMVVTATRPEIMCRGVTSPDELTALMEKATVMVLGPGLGQIAWSRDLWSQAIQYPGPMLVDADGLNLLAQNPLRKDNWILTPHPGEAARLLGVTVEAIQADRLAACLAIQQRYGGVCVLKGTGSLIAAQDTLPALCSKGNPGMATAGMGDVLSGVIGGLLGQHLPLAEAAKLGVSLHAAAGDQAAKDGERGLLAMDLMPYLRLLSNPN